MTKSKTMRKRTPKHVLRLPDLEQSKLTVLNSLTSRSSQRTYDHAIREFIEWYCSEPRLARSLKSMPRSLSQPQGPDLPGHSLASHSLCNANFSFTALFSMISHSLRHDKISGGTSKADYAP
jgi:hypothetical protein